jgi:hypothetical protein
VFKPKWRADTAGMPRHYNATNTSPSPRDWKVSTAWGSGGEAGEGLRDVAFAAGTATGTWNAYVALREQPRHEFASAAYAELLNTIWAHGSARRAGRRLMQSAAPQLRARPFRRSTKAPEIGLGLLRHMESQAWANHRMESGWALSHIVWALGQVHPSWSQAINDILAEGRLRWASIDSWAPAFCAHTTSGPFVQAPCPTNLQGYALLAHELGHAVHQVLRPAAQGDILLNETIAIGCERWCVQCLLQTTSDVQLGQACSAWLNSREDELLGRHTMLHHFECELATITSSGQSLTVETITACWLKHNHAFFGPSIRFAPEFALAWTEVQQLFLHPGSLWVYPAAWMHWGRATQPEQLRASLDSAPAHQPMRLAA